MKVTNIFDNLLLLKYQILPGMYHLKQRHFINIETLFLLMNAKFIHPIIEKVRKRTKKSKSVFSFKFIETETFTSEVQNSMSKKAVHQYNNKTYFLKKTLVFAHIFHIAVLIFLYLVLIFQVNLKKADATSVFKKKEVFLKKNYRSRGTLRNVTKHERCTYSQIKTKGAAEGVPLKTFS